MAISVRNKSFAFGLCCSGATLEQLFHAVPQETSENPNVSEFIIVLYILYIDIFPTLFIFNKLKLKNKDLLHYLTVKTRRKKETSA